jgi:hypothetical protein
MAIVPATEPCALQLFLILAINLLGRNNLADLPIAIPIAFRLPSIDMTELAQLAFALMLWGIIDTMYCALGKRNE